MVAVTEQEVVRADALERAQRTFWPSLGLDVLIAVGPLAYDAVSKWDGSFSAAYWIVIGVGLGKTAVLAAITYALRYARKPKNA